MSAFLFFKQDRVIVIPPVVEKAFWVDQSSVSPTYLEQFGCFIGQLLLGKSEASASLHRDIVLRHTDPIFIGHLKKQLQEEEALLGKQGSSYVFYPERIETDVKNLKVLLVGERCVFVEDKMISTTKEEYVLGFAYSGGRLLLRSLEKKENKHAQTAS